MSVAYSYNILEEYKFNYESDTASVVLSDVWLMKQRKCTRGDW